ncbi:hypothetical protein [Streptomyces sp. MH13]|uniref:hypothetical protein n=1 Tax=Streptomyces sp. MH13 TaxID=3417651 RepID=UPI003CEF1E55
MSGDDRGGPGRAAARPLSPSPSSTHVLAELGVSGRGEAAAHPLALFPDERITSRSAE